MTARRTQRIPAAQRKRRQIKLTLAPDVAAILAAMPGRASRYVDAAVRAWLVRQKEPPPRIPPPEGPQW